MIHILQIRQCVDSVLFRGDYGRTTFSTSKAAQDGLGDAKEEGGVGVNEIRNIGSDAEGARPAVGDRERPNDSVSAVVTRVVFGEALFF